MKWIPFNPDWQPFVETNTPASAPAAKVDTSPSFKMVVAEDDPVSRELICALLQKWGFDVLVTQDGNEALEALRAQKAPTMAVLDWMMPGIDGVEVCRQVRAMEDKLVYILLLTARAAKEQLVEGLQAGADDYLTKPFNKDELHARLKAGLRVLALHATLAERVKELEIAAEENRSLKLQIPL